MSDGALQGARILVVGASSGVGRVVGLQAAGEGAKVAFAARRRGLVDAAAAEAGGGAVGLACDARDEESCAAVVADAVRELGGLDAVVYSTAVDVLCRVADADLDTWADTFATNVFGAARITAAAQPHVRAARGRMVFISASSVDRPLPGMGVYAASKAALETMVRAWQAEHPDVCFATVRIGSALGSGIAASWDRGLLTELAPAWNALGHVHDNGPGGPMTVDQAAASVLAVLTSPVWLREVTAVSDPGRDNFPLGDSHG
ncbi:MAG: SDR family oxidoreductase [Streptomycetaceae bacterium]|nr:SDR family oxidoreductase [Streptomycetaceae bacterium]